MKRLKTFLTHLAAELGISTILAIWCCLALVTLFFVKGFLGWWILGVWLASTAVGLFCYNKLSPPYALKTTIKSQTKDIDLFDNKIFKVIFFYSAQFIPFYIVLKPSEIEWWMYVVWGGISILCGCFIDKNRINSPFGKFGSE